VFGASGDLGAEECYLDGDAETADSLCVGYPATDPSVVSVGGVNAPIDASGRLTGPLTGWGTQTYISGTIPGGSGGGCSIFFTAPSFESSISSSLCAGYRTQPDVSLIGDTDTGVAVLQYASPTFGSDRTIESVGGTSAAAPEAAAMWSLVLQACKQTPSCATGSGSYPYRLGNPNVQFYKIYQNAAEYASAFYNVQFGGNSLPSSSGTGQDLGYTAGVGYSLVTGIGVPFGRNLVKAVTGQ